MGIITNHGGAGSRSGDAAATDLLLEAFAEESICARERPAYELETEYGDGDHITACHLHR